MPTSKRASPIETNELDPTRKETINASDSRNQEVLRISEIRYRRLFEAARDGILILDASNLRITDANPFMMELLGYSYDEFLGKELWEIGLFSDKDASQIALRELRETGYLRYEDLPLQTRNGRRREVEFVSNVYQEDRQEVIQCNIRDITERKLAEEEHRLLLERTQAANAEADKANSIKDAFLAVLSHELRTPLTAILGWATLLGKGTLDEEETRRAIETIARNARAQGQLIEDLLDISRIITGKLRLEVVPVELAPIIETAVESVRPAADSRNIQLQTNLEPRMCLVSGDPGRLQQIIWNLLTNAIKFTPKGGRVEVRLDRVDSHTEIMISDTGQGIAPEFIRHVFERFRQSDASSTRTHGGLGLGLSIVSQLVELHGGTISASSPGKGLGTIFKVELPLLSIHQDNSVFKRTGPVVSRIPLVDPQISLAHLRVLVVDDELDALDLIAAVLMGHGAEVITVKSAHEALEELSLHRFDVLISDIGMPSMDGFELIGRVRRLPADRGGTIPAAALTAYAGVEDRMHVLSAGFQMHIPKPVEPAELTAVVANLAGRYAISETIQ